MRHYAIVGALLFSTGCLTKVEGTSCTADSECANTAACLQSAVSLEGVCVACREPCTQPGETCAYGVCKPKFRLVVPEAGAELGGQVKIVVEAQPGSRQELPEEVTVVARYVPTGETREVVLVRQKDEQGNPTSRYAAEPVLEHDGAYVLTVVLVPETPAPADGVSVSNEGCDPACPAGQECLAQACTPVFAAITLQEPASQLLNTRQVGIVATLERGANTVGPFPETLAAELGSIDTAALATATLQRTDLPGKYAGSVTAPSDGLFTLTVRAAPGPASAPLTLKVDTVPPELSLSLVETSGAAGDPAYPATGAAALYFRRDQTVTLRVDSNELLGSYKFAVRVSSEDYAADHFVYPAGNLQVTQGCAQAQCQSGRLNLYDGQLPMKAFRQALKVRAEGFDKAGNQAFSAEQLIQVTRWKWKASAATYGATEPALGSDGSLYVAVPATDASLPARLLKVDASGALSAVELGALFYPSELLVARVPGATGEAASDAVVVVGTGGTNGEAVQVQVVRGATATPLSCAGVISGTGHRAALALMSEPAMLVGVVQPPALAGATAKLVSVPLAGTETPVCRTFDASFQLADRAQIAAHGKVLYAPDTGGNLQTWTLSDPLSNRWTASAPTPVTASGTVSQVVLAGTQILGTTQGPTTLDGAFFLVGNAARPPAVPPAQLVHSSKGFAIGSSGETLSWFKLDLFPTLKASAAMRLAGAPVVGKDGFVYAAGSDASLAVFDPYGVPAWSAPSVAAGTYQGTSLLLDCNRNADGTAAGKPGVLYVAGSGGTVFAVVVDSHGLDAASSWPIAGRDPYRSRNAAYDRSAFNCP